jgi:hypothetical protein
MARLRCRRVAHPAYSPDLAIFDFCLLGCIKEQLAGVTMVDADGLRNNVMSIVAEVAEDEKSRAFEHWIERGEWVTEHGGGYSHTEKDLADLVSRHRVSVVRCSRLIGHPLRSDGRTNNIRLMIEVIQRNAKCLSVPSRMYKSEKLGDHPRNDSHFYTMNN